MGYVSPLTGVPFWESGWLEGAAHLRIKKNHLELHGAPPCWENLDPSYIHRKWKGLLAQRQKEI